MIKSIEDISGTKKRLSIEIPADAIEQEITRTLNSIKKNARFPGFRPGKAPLSLVEKRFGKDAEAEAIEKVIPKFYSDAIKESNLKPIGSPSLDGGLDFKRNTALGLTFTLEVRPEIKDLRYDGLSVTDISVEIGDDEVEGALGRLRQDRTSYEPTDDAAAEGDVIIMDYESREDEKSMKDEVFKLGTELMPEAFSENLKGKKKGDKAEFEVEFPEDYYSKELAGQKRNFSVEVKEVKKANLPELDDEFAKDLGFDTMDALRAQVRERLEISKKNTIAKMQKAEILQKLVAENDFEAPESLVEGEIENMMAQVRGRAQAGGQEFDEAALRKDFQKNAERNVKASLIVQAIGEQEGTEVSEDEMNERVLDLARSVNMPPENVVKYYVSRDGSIEGLRQNVLEDKVMEALLEKAERVQPKDAGKGGEEGKQ